MNKPGGRPRVLLGPSDKIAGRERAMRPVHAACSIGLCFASFAIAADKPAPKALPTVHEAVRRGIAYLEVRGAAWMNERKCASCHHLPLGIWALNEARSKGFTVDEKVLDQLTTFALAADNRAKVLPNPNDKRPGADNLNLAAIYLSIGVANQSVAEDKSRLTAHIVAKQEKDGAWTGPAGRAPLFDTREVTTMLAVLALDSRRARPAAPDSLAAGRARAAKWLAKAKGNDNDQELALRIVLKTSSGAPAAEYNPLVEKLVNSQRADGGWAQTKDMPSDAFATGQSLYALTLAGKKAEAPVVQKARM